MDARQSQGLRGGMSGVSPSKLGSGVLRRGRARLTLAVISMVLVWHTAAIAEIKGFIGNVHPGYYGNGDNRILLWCFVVNGPFTHQNLDNCVGQLVNSIRETVVTGGQLVTVNASQEVRYHTFVDNECIVYGFINVDNGDVGWMAMANTSATTSRVMRSDRPNTWESNGWDPQFWGSVGWQIRIDGADDDHGNIMIAGSVQ